MDKLCRHCGNEMLKARIPSRCQEKWSKIKYSYRYFCPCLEVKAQMRALDRIRARS